MRVSLVHLQLAETAHHTRRNVGIIVASHIRSLFGHLDVHVVQR